MPDETPQDPPVRRPPTPITSRDQGLTVPEAARALGVHPQSVRNWMRRYDEALPGGLPYSRFGARKLIHPADLDAVRGS